MVPLAKGQGLGVAIMSYDGKMNFGLVGDYDVMHDLEDLAGDLSPRWRNWPRVAGVTLATDAPETGGSNLERCDEKVVESGRNLGLKVDVRYLEQSTATAQEAATRAGLHAGPDRQVAGVRSRR